MKSNGQVIGAVNFNVFLIFGATVIVLNGVYGLDTSGTVAPLTADSPASAEKSSEHDKNLKKLETRFNSEPPPEFYKGPSSSGNRYDSSYDLKYNGGSQRPTSNLLANSGYYNPYLSKHGFYDKHTKDRISIGGGYYSSNDYGPGGGGGGGGQGYSYDRVRPYGPPQAVDMPANAYAQGYHGGGFDSGAASFETDYGPNAYGYGGGGGGNIWSDKMHHLSKSNLLPLAGAALIGIAAALLVNPVLLQLGTVTGKRRRRRDVSPKQSPTEKSLAHNLAYHAHRRPHDTTQST